LGKSTYCLSTLVIAIGVWIEEVGANTIAELRHLTREQQQRIANKMSS
jgi:hypothetical protein